MRIKLVAHHKTLNLSKSKWFLDKTEFDLGKFYCISSMELYFIVEIIIKDTNAIVFFNIIYLYKNMKTYM